MPGPIVLGTIALGIVALDLQGIAGVARSGFPYYKIIGNVQYYGHEGERDADYVFSWGASAIVTYPISDTFSLGFKMSYAASGFEYHFDPRWIPGGSGNYEYDDRLTYRVLNLGLNFISNC